MNRPPNLRHKIKGWVDKAKWFDQGLSFCTSQDLVLLVWSLFYHTPPQTTKSPHTPMFQNSSSKSSVIQPCLKDLA